MRNDVKSQPQIIQEETDDELIAAFRNGDRNAGEKIAQKYYQKVVNTCLRTMGCLEEARDAAQEIFTKVLAEKKILRFRGQAQLWTWLYRVSVNTCKTRLTKKSRLREINPGENDFPEKGEQYPAHHFNPEEAAAWKQKKEFLHRLLSALPGKYRKIIRLIYWEDHTYAQAARRLNMPASHLGVKLMRGKNLLTKLSQTIFPEFELN